MGTEILNRIEVSAEHLRAALEIAVTEKKSTIPDLCNVQLQPTESGIRVISTDLDLSVLTDIDGKSANEKPVLIPCHRALSLLKGENGPAVLSYVETVEMVKGRKHGEYKDGNWVQGEEYETEVKSYALTLEVGAVSYELPAMGTSNFPVTPETHAPQFHVPSPEFRGALSRVLFAISKEESRYTLNGMLLKAESNQLLVATTDGHRMAIQTLEVPKIETLEAILPTPAVSWLNRRLGKGEAGIHVGKENVTVSLPEIHSVLIARRVKGQFPNYEAVMPRRDAVNHVATFPAGDALAKVLTKVSQMADDRSMFVKWKLHGSCELSAESSETGKAAARVLATVTHKESVEGSETPAEPEVFIGLNSSFVLDFLKVAAKESVTMSVRDGQSAALLEIPSIPGYSYIVMPMRI
jgi:DNA polymerase III subunit beta